MGALMGQNVKRAVWLRKGLRNHAATMVFREARNYAQPRATTLQHGRNRCATITRGPPRNHATVPLGDGAMVACPRDQIVEIK
ncbi:hypothetical protein SAMN05216525_12793 [Bradyrhizobium sp. Gha]|nr:hypothetical protein SAMN05216525_12793 [Bradyrhizobium sp. Gha]